LPRRRLTDDDVIQKTNVQDPCGFVYLASQSEIGITRIWISTYAACGITGDATPSDTDLRLTRSVSLAASTMQIQFLDHLIMGAPADCRAGYFSFKEAGLL
jgi:RadC-like JAB domain